MASMIYIPQRPFSGSEYRVMECERGKRVDDVGVLTPNPKTSKFRGGPVLLTVPKARSDDQWLESTVRPGLQTGNRNSKQVGLQLVFFPTFKTNAGTRYAAKETCLS